jgi:hypothetical protein
MTHAFKSGGDDGLCYELYRACGNGLVGCLYDRSFDLVGVLEPNLLASCASSRGRHGGVGTRFRIVLNAEIPFLRSILGRVRHT